MTTMTATVGVVFPYLAPGLPPNDQKGGHSSRSKRKTIQQQESIAAEHALSRGGKGGVLQSQKPNDGHCSERYQYDKLAAKEANKQ